MSRRGRWARHPIAAQVMRRVMPPLVLTWALGAAAAASVATFFTNQAFDGALLDDAYVLASRVEQSGAQLRLAMTPADIKTVLFDQTETIVFAAFDAHGAVFAGQPEFADSAFPPGEVAFAPLQRAGGAMRGVILRRRGPVDFSIVVAQTTTNRRQMLQRLLSLSVLPQLVLLALLAAWLQRAIHHALAPLAALSAAVDERDANDLAPLPAQLAEQAPSLDVKRLGMGLNALLARVGASVQAQREFTGNVAHELRTPLAGIRALADYGLSRAEPAVWREQLQAVLHSQYRASHLIDQLLALALADEAQGGLALTDVALDAVARGVVLQFLPRADAAGADLGAQGMDAPVVVPASVPLVEGILTNLIDNALRHGKGQNQGLTITVGITQTAGAVRLWVADNGPGIPPAMRWQWMLRWSRGATGGRPTPGRAVGETTTNGSGLGLAIVVRYAELMRAQFELHEGDASVEGGDDAGGVGGGGGLTASVSFLL